MSLSDVQWNQALVRLSQMWPYGAMRNGRIQARQPCGPRVQGLSRAWAGRPQSNVGSSVGERSETEEPLGSMTPTPYSSAMKAMRPSDILTHLMFVPPRAR